MSINISKRKCIECRKCSKVCPGNLIYNDQDNKAYIKYPRECWGCAACVKECEVGAIKYYLGADIGGKGSYLYTKKDTNRIHFVIVKEDSEEVISVNKKEANKY